MRKTGSGAPTDGRCFVLSFDAYGKTIDFQKELLLDRESVRSHASEKRTGSKDADVHRPREVVEDVRRVRLQVRDVAEAPKSEYEYDVNHFGHVLTLDRQSGHFLLQEVKD